MTFEARVVLELRTKTSTVRGELILFEDDLITVCLEGRWCIGRLCKDEIRILRITLKSTQHTPSATIVANTHRQLSILLKKCIIPDSFLSFPIDENALFNRPAKGNLAKVIAFL